MDQLAEISLKLLQYANTLAKEYENISINVRKNDGFVALHLECDSKRDKTRKMPSRRGAVARQRRTAKRLHERTSGYESESSSSSASGETPPPDPPDPPPPHPPPALSTTTTCPVTSQPAPIPQQAPPKLQQSQQLQPAVVVNQRVTPLPATKHQTSSNGPVSDITQPDVRGNIQHLAPFLPAPVITKPDMKYLAPAKLSSIAVKDKQDGAECKYLHLAESRPQASKLCNINKVQPSNINKVQPSNINN